MHQHRLFWLMLKPSLFSTAITTTAAVLLVTVPNWSSLLEQMFFYEFLFGSDGLISTAKSQEGADALSLLVPDTFAYTLLVILFAVLVGVILYAVLQSLSSIRNTLRENAPIPRTVLAHEMKQRVIILIAWLAYTVLFVKVVWPLSIIVTGVGVRGLWSLAGIFVLSFGFILLWCGLHAHTVAMRILLGRIRVFGGSAALLITEK